MRATIKLADLSVADKAIKRMAVKPDKVILHVDNMGNLAVVANNNSYVRYTLAATDSKKGTVAINYAMFESLFTLRRAKVKLEKVGNVLKVIGGSTLELYLADLSSKEELNPIFKDSTQQINIPSKKVAILKHMLDAIFFDPVDNVDGTIIQISNTEKGLYIGTADSVHCAHYKTSDLLSKEKFQLTAFLSSLKVVASFLEDKAKVSVSESSLLIESSNITCTLQALQEAPDEIKTSIEFLDNSNYKKGCLLLNVKKLHSMLDSVGVIGEGGDILIAKIKGTDMRLGMKTSYGSSKDKFKLDKNTLGNLHLEIPLRMFYNVLTSCMNDGTVKFALADNEKFYRVIGSTDHYEVRCIAPIANAG